MLTIDPSSSTPPYEQLREQLVAGIETGDLLPGTRLPAVRRLAEELGLAPNTVARTYKDLEAAGWVHTRGRNGTVVATPVADDQTQERAAALTRDYVAAMTALGLSHDDIDRQVQRQLLGFRHRTGRAEG